MKKLTALLMMLCLGMFVVGCGGGETEPAGAVDDAPDLVGEGTVMDDVEDSDDAAITPDTSTP
jgi:PBP1b-binding outer membrane lipoprotein LpoB